MSERVVVKPGATVAVGERPYRIHQILDLETVLAQDPQSGETVRLKVADLQPVRLRAEIPLLTDAVELAQVPDGAWAIARQRFAAIRPLLALSQCTRAQAAECARLGGVHTATIYRWLKRYQHSGQLAALIPWQHNGGRGHSRLSHIPPNLVVTP